MKKTIATITLALVMSFGTIFANAGTMVSDKATTDTCTQKEGTMVSDFMVSLFKSIVGDILPSDTKPCTINTNGTMVSDAPGTMVSD